MLLKMYPFALYENPVSTKFAKHAYLTLQRQLSQLNGHKPDHCQVQERVFLAARICFPSRCLAVLGGTYSKTSHNSPLFLFLFFFPRIKKD
jgi:hypothetical protein